MKSLVKKVVNKLIKKKLTISIAESCTGGLLSSHFTQIPKASETYTFGVITYSNESKNKFLKISKKFLLKIPESLAHLTYSLHKKDSDSIHIRCRPCSFS